MENSALASMLNVGVEIDFWRACWYQLGSPGVLFFVGQHTFFGQWVWGATPVDTPISVGITSGGSPGSDGWYRRYSPANNIWLPPIGWVPWT